MSSKSKHFKKTIFSEKTLKKFRALFVFQVSIKGQNHKTVNRYKAFWYKMGLHVQLQNCRPTYIFNRSTYIHVKFSRPRDTVQMDAVCLGLRTRRVEQHTCAYTRPSCNTHSDLFRIDIRWQVCNNLQYSCIYCMCIKHSSNISILYMVSLQPFSAGLYGSVVDLQT